MALTGADRARRYRLRRNGVPVAPARIGRPPTALRTVRQFVLVLDVTCWCESEIVRVPRRELLAGRTRSCGAPRCREAA